jgi:hypothetical protein
VISFFYVPGSPKTNKEVNNKSADGITDSKISDAGVADRSGKQL